MRILSAFALASLVDAAASPKGTIVSIKSGTDEIDLRRLPQLLRDAGHTPDQKIASFLHDAPIKTLKYVHSQVVKTSALTVDSDILCKFITMASNKLSLQSHCAPDARSVVPAGLDSNLGVNDPEASLQKHLEWMNMREVWEVSSPYVTRKAKVAVLDSGINWNDPDFAPLKGELKLKSGGYLDGGWNLITDSADLTYVDTHGTDVSKVLAAKGNNSYGMGPESGLLIELLVGIDMAVDLQVDTISMSIGFDSALSGIERYFLAGALRSAQENGILLVSAAGNDGKRAPHEYICWYGGPTSICVGALDDNNTQNALASFSNWGEKVDIAAYGEDVYAGSDQGYGVYFSGTSVSTPIVAGFAAILISMGVDPMLVKPLMLANAAPLVPSDHPIRHNGGALNALETVRHAITLLPSRNPRGLRGNFNLGLDK